MKKDVLKNFAKFKETLAQAFSCEFYEFFKKIYFEKHLRTTASEKYKVQKKGTIEAATGGVQARGLQLYQKIDLGTGVFL